MKTKKNFKNVKVVLSIELEGRLGAPVSNTGKKPFWTRRKTFCRSRRTLSNDFVKYSISEESRPYGINSFTWKKMREIERLKEHLKLIADGRKFDFELIDAE